MEGCGFPGFCKEDHADCLSEIVELEASTTDCGHDGGVGNCAEGDGEFASAEDEVCVGCCSA